MKTLAKLALGAVMAGGVALGAAAPAQAAHISVGIGVPVGPAYPAYGYDWCYYHPYAYQCNGYGYYGGPYVVGGYYGGGHYRGGWDHDRGHGDHGHR